MGEEARDPQRVATAAPSRTDRGPRAGAVAPTPMVLPENQLERFYAGGARIDEFRGRAGAGVDAGGAEDWVGSTTTALGADCDGLSRLLDGRLMRDAIQADPDAFLGLEHVRRWGSNPALLVKLLDAGERLPVHFHPGRAFAREALGLRFGKTEAWIILAAEAGAVVYLGLKAAVTPSTVWQWVADQNVAAMLSAMHELAVRPGQVLLVPAGTLHAIGSGILMVELQEPTDLSALLEFERFGVTDGTEHLGLGWKRVLAALKLTPTSPQELVINDGSGARSEPVTELLPARAEPYFRAQRVALRGEPVHLEAGFAILVVLDGRLTVRTDRAERLELRAGQTAMVPYRAGRTTLEGHATLIRCRPPTAHAGPGQW